MLREGSVRSEYTRINGTARRSRRLCERRSPSFRAIRRSRLPRSRRRPESALPQHLTVQVGRPANVAVFCVVPGRGSTLLFPADSVQSGFVEAGSHLVETTLGRNALSDTSKLVRRPQGQQGPPGTRPTSQSRGNAGMGRDVPAFGFNQHGYLLIFASQSAMPYSILSTRVSGISDSDRGHRRAEHGDQAHSPVDEAERPVGRVRDRLPALIVERQGTIRSVNDMRDSAVASPFAHSTQALRQRSVVPLRIPSRIRTALGDADGFGSTTVSPAPN